MTRRQLVRKLAGELGMSFPQAFKIFQKTTDLIIEGLTTDGIVNILTFGRFEVRRRGPRFTCNPSTKEKTYRGPVNMMGFRPGSKLKTAIRAMDPSLIKKKEEGA